MRPTLLGSLLLLLLAVAAAPRVAAKHHGHRHPAAALAEVDTPLWRHASSGPVQGPIDDKPRRDDDDDDDDVGRRPIRPPPVHRRPPPDHAKPREPSDPLPAPHPMPPHEPAPGPLPPSHDEPMPGDETGGPDLPPGRDLRPHYNILLDPGTRIMFVPAFAFLGLFGFMYLSLWSAAIHAERHRELARGHRLGGYGDEEAEQEALLGGRRAIPEYESDSEMPTSPRGRPSAGDLTRRDVAEAEVQRLVHEVRTGQAPGTTPTAERPSEIEREGAGSASGPSGTTRPGVAAPWSPPIITTTAPGAYGETVLGEAEQPQYIYTSADYATYTPAQPDLLLSIKNAQQVACFFFMVTFSMALMATMAGTALPTPTRHDDVVGSRTRVLTLAVTTWGIFAVGVLWSLAEGTFLSVYDIRKTRTLSTLALVALVVTHAIALERENRARVWGAVPPATGIPLPLVSAAGFFF